MAQLAIDREAQLALVKLLIKLQLIAKEQDDHRLYFTDSCPISHFANLGLLDEDDAIELVATRLGIVATVVDRATADAAHLLLDSPFLAPISLDRWQSMRALPLAFEGDVLTVAFANPLDQHSRKALNFDLGCSITVAIAREGQICGVLAKKMSSSNSIDLDELVRGAPAPAFPAESSQRNESDVEEGDVSAPPVVRLVNKILSESAEWGASDLHINPERDHLSVKVRVDGIIRPLIEVPGNVRQAVTSRLKLLSGMDIAEKRRPQDGRLRIRTASGSKDLRFSTVPTIFGENMVVRILRTDMGLIDLAELGLSSSDRGIVERALGSSGRMLLATGPTGSGKTSTLYACLAALRDGTTNIMTIEDPIEYRVEGINQMQVNPKIDVTFADGLRSMLRQDPDVIMVGEMRDLETCSIAMQAAQTGHLVLSTLHTNSAAATVTRLRDIGLPPYIIASTLGCVVAQRLVRRLCPLCSRRAIGGLARRVEELGYETDRLREAGGCDECGGSGYRGRIPVFSVLDISHPVREAIRKDCSEQEIERTAAAAGFRPLALAALDLVASGITTIEETERSIGPIAKPAEVGLFSHRPKPSIEKPHVLLVEDDENAAGVLRLLLEREMFEVEEARDGLEALEKIFARPPKIIVCDLMMPRLSGLDMVRRLRKDERGKTIPVLMLTAVQCEDTERQLLESGADDYVRKGSDPKVMIARVHNLLERSQKF